jgi:hypothetical protein
MGNKRIGKTTKANNIPLTIQGFCVRTLFLWFFRAFKTLWPNVFGCW